MRLIKRDRTDRYVSEDAYLKVDVGRENDELTFTIERLSPNVFPSSVGRICLGEEKLKALIDLYYEVRPETGCRHAWKYEKYVLTDYCLKCDVSRYD